MVTPIEDDPGWKFLRQSREEQAEAMAKPFDSKKNCWIPDTEEGYIAAEVKSTKGDMVTLWTAKNTEVTLKKELTQEMNPPKFFKTEDMANLTFLNEASVLDNLRQRYFSMMIYTYSGLFCVVINPYKRLPIYTESVITMYQGKRRNEMPPHLFAVSDEAYRNMVQDRENQSMLITGESGAGKTENTKKVISYFALVGASVPGAREAKEGQKGGTLEEQIVQTNPVLEAFGNAKTVRNNNSSRFGKFIRSHFSRDGKLAGGDIEHYLLEKSRVIRQAPGERDFHIFYQIMSGHQKDLRGNLKLTEELPNYHFCSQAELTIDGVNDANEFRDTDLAFDIMGFEHDEKNNLFRFVAGIMHMGEMKFKQRPREEQAEIDGTHDAENACFNFTVEHEKFLHALVKPRVRVGTEWVNKGQNIDQVHWAVNGLAKAIYARMFKWLIERCNKTLDAKAIERKHFIGVLDIAGFEIFDFNSFEQLWINFVNERLQQFFNHHMFVLEQEEYQREGIQWEFIDFGLDLQACIELIEKPLGIISMLDEECIVPKATDMTLAQKLNDQHLGKHPNFLKPKPPKGKQAEAHFAVGHYAGTVRYNVKDWLEKNKDPLNDSAVAVLKGAANNQLMVDIWADYQTQEEAMEAQKAGVKEGAKKKGKSASFMTVSMLYRESLNKLMTMLYGTHPHFVRCIIPNEKKKSGLLDAALTLNQLTCNGVLEGIRICRKGFPNRMLYPDFKQRYTLLAADAAKSSDDPVKSSQAILDVLIKDGHLKDEDFRRGETKVFFKAGVLAKLEDGRDQKLTAIMTGFQSHCRSFVKLIDKKRRLEQKAAMTLIQRGVRNWLELRTWAWFVLYGKVLPMARQGKIQEQLDALSAKVTELQGDIEKEQTAKNDLNEVLRKLEEEANELREQMKLHGGDVVDMEDKVKKVEELKNNLEKEVQEATERLNQLEDSNAALGKEKKRVEGEMDALKKQIQDLELSLRKAESEKGSKEHQIKSLQEEMGNQDELVAKLNKEMKHQGEVSKKLTEDLQGEEDKVNHLNKVKAKLDAQVESLEDSLEREKRLKQDAEKSKRKADGELKVLNESIEEMNKQRHDLEVSNKRKEQEMHTCASKLEDEQSMVAKLQKQVKELQARTQDIEEELEGERESHAKADRSKNDIQREIEELSQRLEEAGGATAAQFEMNKKREAELAKLRRDLEESNMNHETQLNNLRKKHSDAVAEMSDQIEQIQKAKSKVDKEKAQITRETTDIQSAIDVEAKAKQDLDKTAKTLELQLAELQAKSDEQTRQLSDFNMLKGRLQNENADLNRQLEDTDGQIGSLQHIKQQMNNQLEDAKRMADDESRERQTLGGQLKNIQHENDSLRDQLEEESESKAELQRHISKLNGEIQQWKAKFDSEGLAKIEEIEEAKRKLSAKASELTESIDAANQKIVSLEKTRHKLMGDLDDAQVEVERANSYALSLERKQKNFDQLVDEWRKKCDDVAAELDAVQRDNRALSTECFKLKNMQDELSEAMESLRRENKNMSIEIKDLTDQLGEGGRSVHELQKMSRRLEVEKEELQHALEEAESALEAEESKVLRAQVEVSQIRSEIEKRIQEKEEEFENTRKNHQRALDSMQVTLESEVKGKQEALRVKKKLESDINELEIALDHANKANADAQKNIKKYQEQIRELQMHIDEEQRQKDDLREQFNNSERRILVLTTEKDELMVAGEQSDRGRRNAELDSQEQRDMANDLSSQNASLSAIKRKAEGELQALHTDLDESLNELKQADEAGKKAMADASRLAEELRQEQEHSTHVERMRKGLEDTIKEMQVRLEEAEEAALKGGKKIIAKLEQRIRELEQELDGAQRRYQETDKNLRKTDRRIKELDFQVEEDKKNSERQQDLVEKLQAKIKTYKRQIDEAEEVAGTNLAKYRQLQQQLEDSEERADMAENSLSKLRSKTRISTSMTTTDITTSASAAGGLFRSSSRARASASALTQF